MSRHDDIQAALRQVVGNSPITLSKVWSYRRLTSKYGVEPRTYGNWTEFCALGTGGSLQETFEPHRAAFTTETVQRIRCADNDPEVKLRPGDQVKDPEDLVWVVRGHPTSGPGTIAYTISREKAMLGDADRKGGV